MRKLSPAYWGALIFIAAQAITFGVISRESVFLRVNKIYITPQPPSTISIWPTTPPPAPPGQTAAPAVGSLGPILIYFFAVVVVLGIVLFLVPISALKYILRIMFAFLFTWGIFIILVFWLPIIPTLVIAAGVGVAWFLAPKVWLHNIAMVLVMVSLGAVFGPLLSPWTAMVLLLVLAVYDFLAVRLGYMVWIAKKMSQAISLPAFVIPRGVGEWGSSLKTPGATNVVQEDPGDRKYSILGGGDVGFPLLLTSSVFFAYGVGSALFVAGFSLIGLLCAYLIQSVFLKGKAMPALPPIAALTLIALLVLRFA